MATEKANVNVTTCDACGSEFYHRDDEEPPLGFYIPKGVFWIHGSGGTGTREGLYFDTKTCLKRFANNIAEYME